MGDNDKADLTAIILTKNEEINIARCINSIKGIAKRIVVVDSYSTDQTVELAKSLGAEVFQHPWKHYANQFNWALDNVHVTTQWIYRIDADEYVSPELAQEIVEECERHRSDDINGFIMIFKIFFLGRFLMHGGCYPFYNLTIFKKGKGRYEDRAMGEHIVLSEGRDIILKNDCIHYDFKDLQTWVEKHIRYAQRELQDYSELRNGKALAGLYGEAEKAKKIRDNYYYRLPKFLRAKFYYWYRYYIKLGFLDGRPGKMYAFLQAYWYRYLVDAMIYEKEINNEENAD